MPNTRRRAYPEDSAPSHRASSEHSSPEHESALIRFARAYGWRAYAVPVLVVITVWVLVDVFTGGPLSGGSAQHGTRHSAAGGAWSQSDATEEGPRPEDSTLANIPFTELPPGGAYTESGSGTYREVGSPGAAAGEGTELVVRYVVEVEDGVDTASMGGDDAFSAMVDATLTSPKSWIHDPRYRFEHVTSADDPTMHIQLTSVDTTHELCGHELAMETSCFYSLGNRVLVNNARWIRGATPFQGDLGSYRQYLINHEVGHGIGYANHEPCGADGELAPVMMQQTLSLNNSELHSFDPTEVYPDDNLTCLYNPWPYPRTS